MAPRKRRTTAGASKKTPATKKTTRTRKARTDDARPPFSLTHHADCGDVGDVGEVGDLGTNAIDHPLRVAQDKDGIHPNDRDSDA